MKKVGHSHRCERLTHIQPDEHILRLGTKELVNLFLAHRKREINQVKLFKHDNMYTYIYIHIIAI